jgi:hypothetical protein
MEKSHLDSLRHKFVRQTEKGLEALHRAREKRSNRPTDLDRSTAGFACNAALAMLCLFTLGPAAVIMAAS